MARATCLSVLLAAALMTGLSHAARTGRALMVEWDQLAMDESPKPSPIGNDGGSSSEQAEDPEVCYTLWEVISAQPSYSYLAEALQNNGLDEVLNHDELDLTLLCPDNEVFDAATASFKLTPDVLAANTTENRQLWAFHIIDRTIFYSTVLEDMGADSAVTFPTLLENNRMTIVYRNSSENFYVTGYEGKSLLRTFKVEDGSNPILCSGKMYKIDDIMLPNLDATGDNLAAADIAGEEYA